MAAIGNYPLPKFHFRVEWGTDFRMGFTEVSGLDFETEVVEYREGNSLNYAKSAQPALRKWSDVTLKRGIFEGDLSFYTEWQKTYLFQEGNDLGSQFRRPVTIKLLNEAHDPIITWDLENAWPSKVQSTDLKADASEVSIETLVLKHEGMTMS